MAKGKRIERSFMLLSFFLPLFICYVIFGSFATFECDQNSDSKAAQELANFMEELFYANIDLQLRRAGPNNSGSKQS